MKTSFIIVALIILNTSALLSETLASLVSGIDSWLFIALELVLLIIFYLNHQLKGLNDLANIDLSDIELFVIKQKNKTQGKP